MLQVDPLLRARLWNYLMDLTSAGSTTSVIITTHYIEEARQVCF
jgi:ABC-type multidrug transport system ATPase subunit